MAGAAAYDFSYIKEWIIPSPTNLESIQNYFLAAQKSDINHNLFLVNSLESYSFFRVFQLSGILFCTGRSTIHRDMKISF